MAAAELAMRRSLREGFVELLVASLRPALERRDIVGQVQDVKTAFSSWDNCMQASYCKYPVIAIIVVGGLIVLSIVWCIARCLCCGLSCCCECCQFFKCCGNCCGCCDPPRGKRSKYLDEPYIPPSQGYKMQPPMNPHFPAAVPTMTPANTGYSSGVTSGVTAVPSHYADTPQYAEFDVSKPKGEDSLPAMPSWEGAGKKKVMLEGEDAVELDQLKKPEASGQNGAMLTGAAAVPSSTSPLASPANRSPYGPPPGNPANNGYYPAPAVEADPYAPSAHTDPYAQSTHDYPPAGGAYSQTGGAYGQASSLGADQGYGMAGAAMAPGRHSPYNDNGYGQPGQPGQGRGGYASPGRQDSFNSYGVARQGTGGGYNDGGYSSNNANPQGGNMNQGAGYGMPMPSARRSPPNELAGDSYTPNPVYAQQDPVRRSPAPQANYGASNNNSYDNAGYDSRGQYSTDSSRPLRAPPQRQYSRDVVAPAPVSASGNTSGGFDFGTGGYSRPQAGGSGGYRQPSPPQPQQPAGGYPGYKPYQPNNGGGGGGGQGGGW